jgi:hypothetical protein
LVAVVFLGTVATADNRFQMAAEKLNRCTSEAGRWLAGRDGSAEMLAERALSYCRAQEKALQEFLDPRAIKALRAITKAANARFIEQERRLQARGSNPTTGREIYCASCGMLPTWDDRLRVWRPHGR